MNSPDLKDGRRKQPAAAPDIAVDRLPPHDIVSEQAILGCILLDPRECLPETVRTLSAGPEVFYDLRHRTIYECLLAMQDDATGIDAVSLYSALKAAGNLEGVGGLAYLSSLPDYTPSAANLGYYLPAVRDAYLLRRLIRVGTEMVQAAQERQGGAQELLSSAERNVLAIGREFDAGEMPSIKELVRHAIDDIEALHASEGRPTGLSTGLIDLDKLTGGLHGGEMIVFAALSSGGKTALAIQIAERVAVEDGIPVGIFSLEMTGRALAMRMILSRGRLNIRDIGQGSMTAGDFPKITAAASKISRAKIFIDDTAALPIRQLQSRMRRMHQQHGVKLFVIDYLQLAKGSGRHENRQTEVTDISQGIKAIAKELGVPVIVLSQLNREFEKEKTRKPRLSDIRESGSVGMDADFVGMLYRTDDDDHADAVPMNLIIAKQRNGPAGVDVNLLFLKKFTRFESAAREGVSHD